MVISQSPAAKLAAEGKLCFDGVPLPLQETVKIREVGVDRELRFDGHIKHIAKKASHRVTTLQRMATQIWPYLSMLPSRGIMCILAHQETGQHPVSSLTTGGCCRLTGTPQGRRDTSGVPQGTGTENSTPDWVTPASMGCHAEHKNGAS